MPTGVFVRTEKMRENIRASMIGKNTGKKPKNETKEKISKSHKLIVLLKKNSKWKGNNVLPHYWIILIRGKAKEYKCELCGKQAIDWSNKDHKYRKVVEDWQTLCRGCHLRFDSNLRKINKIKETKQFREAKKMPGFSEKQYLEMLSDNL